MDTEYHQHRGVPKRKILLVIAGAVGIVIVSAAIGFFTSMTTSRVVDTQAVKDELITQNTRLKAGIIDGKLSSETIAQVSSTDTVTVNLKVSSDESTYCIEAYLKKDAKGSQYHMDKDTPDTEPLSGVCGDGAKAAPEAVTGLTLGATGSTTASLLWDTIPNAKSYTLECSISQNFSDAISKTFLVDEGTISELTSGVTYNCRVAAENSAGRGGWSQTVPITTHAQVLIPKDLTITTVSSTSLTYAWKPVAGAKEYVLEYATDAAFSQNVKTLRTNQTQGALTNLSKDTGFYFHVKAITDQTTELQAPFSPMVPGRTPK